jgi:hypothetical protein
LECYRRTISDYCRRGGGPPEVARVYADLDRPDLNLGLMTFDI